MYKTSHKYFLRRDVFMKMYLKQKLISNYL